MSFGYTTRFSETPLTGYTRTFRYYDCSTGGTILNALTIFTDAQDRHIRTQDTEAYAVGEQGAGVSASPVTLLSEDSDAGLRRVVRALAGVAGVFIHEATTQTVTIQGRTTTRLIRESLYYIAGAVLSGTDLIVPP